MKATEHLREQHADWNQPDEHGQIKCRACGLNLWFYLGFLEGVVLGHEKMFGAKREDSE